MKVWVTRAEPEAQNTAQALIAAGHTPMVEPLLRIQALPGADEALALAAAQAASLAFTSAAAVRTFALLRPGQNLDLPVFAVGAATARAARAAGFQAVTSADGDVSNLAERIAAARPSGPVLHPSALEPSGDLVGDLTARGVEALAAPIYETVPRAPSRALLQILDQDPPGMDAVMIHSAKAGRALAQLLVRRPGAAGHLVLSAISGAAGKPLSAIAFARRAIAAAPNEPAMLNSLRP
jgi:uroporphyrinogen-III synthase